MTDGNNRPPKGLQKNLGKQGGATARLEDGTNLILKPDYAVKQARGYVDGLLRDVEFHLPYKKVYDQIRTIKRCSSYSSKS